jgi:glycosyltransferase involved in cell wall biosynthesis
MNQEYILLAGLLWKALGKRIAMWRNHYAGSVLTNIAAWFCVAVFYTSAASYTKRFAHAHAMPIGIDSDLFRPQPGVERVPDSFLYVGRLSRSKRIDVLLAAFKLAHAQRPTLTLSIVGGTTSPEDERYAAELKAFVSEYSLPVTFVGPVPWAGLPRVYSAHELCINLSPPGMFDKVIGESVLCGCDILTSNQDLIDVLGRQRVLDEAQAQALSETLQNHGFSQAEVEHLREALLASQSLSSLVAKVIKKMDQQS